ncbi:MAG: hypothetical protein AAGJ87_06540, partial [Pseudomonadota bacterium]
MSSLDDALGEALRDAQDDRRKALARNDEVAIASVERARAALVAASSKAQTLWISFISFSAYYFVSISAVTHRDLFLETPIKLPVIGVELPLIGYFLVAPVLFLIFHVYIFFQFRLLTDNARLYRAREATLVDRKEVDRLRTQLPNFFVVKLQLGASDQIRGSTGFFIRAIAFATLMFGPIVILLAT